MPCNTHPLLPNRTDNAFCANPLPRRLNYPKAGWINAPGSCPRIVRMLPSDTPGHLQARPENVSPVTYTVMVFASLLVVVVQ